MKAWQFVGARQPLVLAEVDIPEPKDGEILIDIKASGLCHTMVGMVDGTLSFLAPSLPQTLGDELAGVVCAVGPGVESFNVGDRVANAAIGPETAGVGRDGGFAEKVAVRADRVVHIPDGVSFTEAAAATDAGATSYGAVHEHGCIESGERVGIIGYGGLGSIAARIALAAGAEVYVAEVNSEARELAQSTGDYKVVEDVLGFEPFNLNVIMDFAGFGTTTAGAVEVIAPYGRIVQVGTGKATAEISVPSLIAKHLQLVGSSVDNPRALARVLGLLADKKLSFDLTEISFDQIGDGLVKLERGEVRGRLIAIQE
ncbi:zinc-binding dehydrogenase [Rhodococcus sp. IEGM 1305]|uniref:alcohol dehydrogenase catalytic domain-containing protein n=1 Tax=Rhodococcus sp. IEGM 1305 TaxID=3047092 RepID=UPI0024B717F1|nr:zinc-binding dehydrogenase [Rhodococcus sp. IEGM 1305]MDI9953627.1 zinc-binding dehydrogenase [Rhodococcus sp. IEGM 1305]